MSEPTDEECQTVAMLAGLYFNKTFRYNGKKCLYKTYRRSSGLEPPRYVQYLDPVTMEVMGELSVQDHYDALNKSFLANWNRATTGE